MADGHARAERLVNRQLRKAGLRVEPGSAEEAFVALVRSTYAETDDQRRLNDHAFSVASDEMAALNLQLATKNTELNDALESLLRSEQIEELNAALSDKNRELSRLANTDSLTGLLNRYSFGRAVRGRLTELDEGSRLALAVVDLDRFKLVNDTFGHHAGDRLLIEMAHALRGVAEADDLIARLGGDEFAVARIVESAVDVDNFAKTIADALHQPVVVDNQVIPTGASVGIAVADRSDIDTDDLMRDADTAMYRAKDNSTTRFRVFDHRFRQEVTRRFVLEKELHRAIDNNQIEVVYQPIVDTVDGTLAVEALARWSTPTLGSVSPLEFVPAIERLGLANRFGRHVLETACAQLEEWRQRYREPQTLALSINITYSQLIDADFLALVNETIARHGLGGSCLILELTESELLDDFDRAVAAITALRELGVQIAIDDFGTGYSALSYLARVPADFLKIDKSFVWATDADDDALGQRLAWVIVDLAERFGLRAIAEGVETPAQLSALESFGCRLIQGYLVARPTAAGRVASELEWTPIQQTLGHSSYDDDEDRQAA